MWKSLSYKISKSIANVQVTLSNPPVNKGFITLMFVMLDCRK